MTDSDMNSMGKSILVPVISVGLELIPYSNVYNNVSGVLRRRAWSTLAATIMFQKLVDISRLFDDE